MGGNLSTIATIESTVRHSGPEGASGDLDVRIGSQLVLRETDFPLSLLANSLKAWAAGVNDQTPSTYVFTAPGRQDLVGAFRIEPRPVGWQFTSVRELARHAPISLEEWLRAIGAFESELASDVPAA